MAQDNSIIVSLGVDGSGVLVSRVSVFGHHTHVDEPQEFAYFLYVLLTFIGGNGLGMVMEFQCGIHDDPNNFSCVCTDCLMYPLPIPVARQLPCPAFVASFNLVKLT